jgi:hypothetical protein
MISGFFDMPRLYLRICILTVVYVQREGHGSILTFGSQMGGSLDSNADTISLFVLVQRELRNH